MLVIETVAALRQHLAAPRAAGQLVGLVPTMGYLHAGHLSLVEAARRDCTLVVMSIFVNPRQFGPQEDLESYPRDLARDLDLAGRAGVDVVFTPGGDEVYPNGYQTEVIVSTLTQPLCGATRPGHFNGVTTVVAKLFNMVSPDYAYFGQKDYQQAAVIQRMVTDLNMPLTIVVCPTVREDDGLAMSSRNAYLSSEERQAALVLSRSLSVAQEQLNQGERDPQRLEAVVRACIVSEPRARIDYVTVCDPQSLQELDVISDAVVVVLAVFIGNTRLIDNAVLSCPTHTT